MANRTMRYETILVLHPGLGEEAIKAMVEKFTALIQENGTLEKVEEWGKRRLAYPIQDQVEGYYVLMQFESAPSYPAELTRICNITDGVMHSLVVRNEFDVQKPAEQKTDAAAVAEEVPAQVAPQQE